MKFAIARQRCHPESALADEGSAFSSLFFVLPFFSPAIFRISLIRLSEHARLRKIPHKS
jgi:hypothetical protein